MGKFPQSPEGVRPSEQEDALKEPELHAIWVWDARAAADRRRRDALLAFCQDKGVNTLYLSAYDLRPPMDEVYREFNRLAHRKGLTVHALAGDPRWGKPQYHHIPLEWIRVVQLFNTAARDSERFDGIHTDIEVYLLAKTWAERPEVLLGGYLDLTLEIARKLKGDPLAFGADIPFWYDDDTTYRILWNGQIKAPSHHVMDYVDQMTVMAYRNFAEGSDGTIHLVSLELDYADQTGKRIVIGQETQQDLFPAYVTFGGSSCRALEKEMEKIRQAVGHRPGFGGFAIHHYESYQKLCGE